MFAGQLACEALNWVLKRTIREERPHRTHSRPLSSLEQTLVLTLPLLQA